MNYNIKWVILSYPLQFFGQCCVCVTVVHSVRAWGLLTAPLYQLLLLIKCIVCLMVSPCICFIIINILYNTRILFLASRELCLLLQQDVTVECKLVYPTVTERHLQNCFIVLTKMCDILCKNTSSVKKARPSKVE